MKHPLDEKLELAIKKLMKALDWKEDRYEHSCCADELIALVFENETMEITYEDEEIHFRPCEEC
tara:strand:+ start:1744 stop:1935 length:192 start_codon:yes stop_codon:yes gene_type:complete